jgi:hypothetical protein
MLRHARYALLLAAIIGLALPAAAEDADEFYRASFVVTGQSEANRLVGFAETFGRVLVKLSGDATVIDDPRFAALAADAPRLVQDFGYRDRFEGKPIHDEQGSYDRPHDLTVSFDVAGTNAALATLGRKPWRDPRPRLFVMVGVENMRASFVLTRDGVVDRSADMRAAFAAAGERMAMTIAFPTTSQVETSHFAAKTMQMAKPAEAATLAPMQDVTVLGHMVFSEAALGWVVDWRMEHAGRSHAWSVRGVNFDAAFRSAVFGAAEILSGNGEPR